ncbi:uncharacterized protein LOC126291979 isoform X2 [Schistocerca gregaria]|uniref:uncharacterized protein LOC126291979 isoform X2 n=1 Tax=Schistocerca gregaria TaxID=7010 RepID=UPI00211E0807|nr:uncharacterized protein LOC126291979 isoform X2 [Schistocerca gregaria]
MQFARRRFVPFRWCWRCEMTSVLVAIEMLEKMLDDNGFIWSPLRLIGPQPWVPIFNISSRFVAIQVLIFAMLFCASNVLLIFAAVRSNRLLGIPFLAIYPCKIVYSMVVYSALYSPMYTHLDAVVTFTDVGVDIMIYVAVAMSLSKWVQRRYPTPDSGEREPILTEPA